MTASALALAAVLAAPAAAAGQAVHPCDQPAQTTPAKGSRIGWCHDLRDDDGLSVSALGFKVSIAGALVDLGTMTPIGNPSAGGLYYFEAALPNGQPRGSFAVFVVAYNDEGVSAPSNAITWQRGGAPNKPTNPRIAILREAGGAMVAVLRPAAVAIPRALSMRIR